MSAPLKPPAERTVQAVGARRSSPPEPPVRELVQRLRQLAGTGEGLVALFDARSVAGERHLLSAWAHLGRARSRGVERLRDRGAELALFMAGDDQLPRALARVGVQEDTDEFVVVAERPRDLDELMQTFGLVADPAVYPRPPDERTLDRLGISPAERRSVPASAWEGLVLERVAFLELSGPHAPPPHRSATAGGPRPDATRRKSGSASAGKEPSGSATKKH